MLLICRKNDGRHFNLKSFSIFAYTTRLTKGLFFIIIIIIL